jgi:hypothetical protein
MSVHLKTIDRIQVMEKNGKFWLMTHESEDVKPYSTKSHDKPLLPWESFHDWLRLMVHHFDAIHVLDSHLMSLNLPSPIDIFIKIIYPSLLDEHMLPWKELLENEKYFPPIPHTCNQPSAAEFITFLTLSTLDGNGNGVKELIEDINTIKLKQTLAITAGTVYVDFTLDIGKLTEQVKELKDFSSAGWEDFIVDILQQVEALSDSTTQSRLSQLDCILNMLENLKGSFLLYKKVQPGTSLSLGMGFSGSGHCEVYAAVLNSLSGTPGPHNDLSENLLEEFKVSHISVPCSNLCQTLQYRQPNKSSECLNNAAQSVLACSAN